MLRRRNRKIEEDRIGQQLDVYMSSCQSAKKKRRGANPIEVGEKAVCHHDGFAHGRTSNDRGGLCYYYGKRQCPQETNFTARPRREKKCVGSPYIL